MWHKWFAWHPVKTLGGRMIWLRSVERKFNPNGGAFSIVDVYDHGDFYGAFEYRLPICNKENILRENQIEQYLHTRVKALGGDYRRVSWIGRNGANDDLILLPGRHTLVECKRPGKAATIAQAREHTRLRAAGFEVNVVSTTAEIDTLFPLTN